MASPSKIVPSQYLLEWKLAVEQELDVNSCFELGLHVWPLAWIYLGMQLVNDDLAVVTRWQTDPHLANVRETLKDRYARAEGSISRKRVRRPDVWLSANSLWRPRREVDEGVAVYTLPSQHHLRLDSGYYAPMIDPFVKSASRHAPVRKFEWILPDSYVRQPRIFPSFGLLNEPFPAGRPDIPKGSADRIAEFIGMICDHGRRIGMPTDVACQEEATRTCIDALQNIINIRRVIGSIFRSYPPRYLFLSCYHQDVAWAARLAAREVDAPTFDMQHGFAGEFNWQNSHWSAFPAEGYALFPDAFAIWDQRSADHATRYWPTNGHPHRVVEIGRPDLSFDIASDEWAAHDETVKQIVSPWSKTVLVTLSSTLGGGLSDLLMEAIRMAPKNWLWMIRCHPVASLPEIQPAGIMSALMQAGIGNAVVFEPSALPLASWLRRTSHHVTSFSSSVLDAAAIGVPTTFVSPLSQMLTADLIRDRLAGYATNAEELIASISNDDEIRSALSVEQLAKPGIVAIDGLLDMLLGELPPT